MAARTISGDAMTSTEPTLEGPLTDDELDRLNAYWRAANYLTVGQIYLLDNPLLREPLKAADIKPRLLGHWGTSPGLNLIYARCSRTPSTRTACRTASSTRTSPGTGR
jgi:xylulose-5-phosphate/fructose-6-phosphate phosphoketolase